MIKYRCPACGGDGISTCSNPDHGFITGVGGELARLGCPCCGHDPNHKMKGPCDECNGLGYVSYEQALIISEDYGKDDELEIY